ncbi:MAG: cupin domain-containing protein [Lentisphaerae bacterium]|nr:cupin domain-containing protein [Lentisphaerota bacterium]
MKAIQVEHHPSEQRLKELGVRQWPTWTKEPSTFPWTYDEPETCYFLEGDVTVTPDGGAPVTLGQGDLVTFPSGLACAWTIRKPVKKHYRFG